MEDVVDYCMTEGRTGLHRDRARYAQISAFLLFSDACGAPNGDPGLPTTNCGDLASDVSVWDPGQGARLGEVSLLAWPALLSVDVSSVLPFSSGSPRWLSSVPDQGHGLPILN